MMKILLHFILIVLAGFHIQAQVNTTLISHVDYTADKGNGNDIWAYIAPQTGDEYAIVGTTQGTLVYSLEDTANPIERRYIPGSNSTWRDMKQWGEYVYVTCDSGTDGLLIINMSNAPEDITFEFIKPKVLTDIGDTLALDRCHNIFIDEFGIIYLTGCQGRGVEFFDPKVDPMNPEYISSIISPYCHDAYASNNILHASQLNNDFVLYDVTDKKNPILLGNVETSSDFTHNAWGDPENNYTFTTDEVGYGFLDAYDISDPENIQYLDKWQPKDPTNGGIIPHNTHYIDGYLVISWYTSGLIVLDANKPDNLVLVAEYDTYDGPDGGFNGCWGATPYLPSGAVLANDIDSGFYIFDVNYQRACYLEGIVTDISNGDNINGVKITFDDPEMIETTSNAVGMYKEGRVTPGMVEVTYSHPEYESKTVSYDLKTTEIQTGDVQLVPKAKINFTVNVNDLDDNNPLDDVIVQFVGTDINYDVKSSNGKAALELVEGTYDIIVGKWGYQQYRQQNINVTDGGSESFLLSLGYSDAFILDFGWTVTGNATSGSWVREKPIGTYNGQGQAVAPGGEIDDILVDIEVGEIAYITGNGGGGQGTDDIDNGNTILTSPIMDWSNYPIPNIHLSTWFINSGGMGNPNDALTISITDGSKTELLREITTSDPNWQMIEIPAADIPEEFLQSSTIQLIIESYDTDPGHIVEAGVDAFYLSFPVGTEDQHFTEAIEIYPNPTSNFINFYSDVSIKEVKVLNLLGEQVSQIDINDNSNMVDLTGLQSGVYTLIFFDENGLSQSKKVAFVK